MPEDLSDRIIAESADAHRRLMAVRNGTVYASVTGNVVRIAYEPIAVVGNLCVEVVVRGDEPVTRAVLEFVNERPGRTDAEQLRVLAELGRVLDASYPNYVPSGLYSALVGG